MVVVAQLVRAPGCGPGGRGFESLLPPHSCIHGGAPRRSSDFFASETEFPAKQIVSSPRFAPLRSWRRGRRARPPELVCGCPALLDAGSICAACARRFAPCGPGDPAVLPAEAERSRACRGAVPKGEAGFESRLPPQFFYGFRRRAGVCFRFFLPGKRVSRQNIVAPLPLALMRRQTAARAPPELGGGCPALLDAGSICAARARRFAPCGPGDPAVLPAEAERSRACRGANGSARDMGTCISTGQAAAKLAAEIGAPSGTISVRIIRISGQSARRGKHTGASWDLFPSSAGRAVPPPSGRSLPAAVPSW